MPTKTVVIPLPFHYYNYQRQYCNAVFESHSWPVAMRTKTRTGYANPRWKDQVRAGVSATTSMTASDWFVENLVSSDASVVRKHASPTWPCGATTSDFAVYGQRIWPQVHGDYGGGDLTEADNKAKMQAVRAVQAQYRQWQGSIFLAEILQTARMLISPAKALRNRVSSYLLTLKNKKRKVTARQWGRVVADEWLEVNFGLRPLINDMTGLAETVARYADPDGMPWAKLRATGRSERLRSNTASSGVDNNYIYSTTYSRVIGKTRVVYRLGMRYALQAPFDSWAKLARLGGFTSENWLPTAWEVIPWSFFIDYFVNIGDILTFACADFSSVAWVNKSVIVEGINETKNVVNHKLIRDTMLTEYGGSFGSSLGAFKSTARSVTRSAGGLQPPELSMRVPAVDSASWLNIAALGAQLNDLNRTSFYRR